MRKLILVGGVVVLIACAAALYFVMTKGSHSGDDSDSTTRNQGVLYAKPLDIALDFYEEWLRATLSTSTDPYSAGLAARDVLSEGLRARIQEGRDKQGGTIDPILCQSSVPQKIYGRPIFELPNERAEVLIFSKENMQAGQAVVTLRARDNGWYIEDIRCSKGEFDDPREFTFDQEGQLLKQVPMPYNPQLWHIVYSQNNIPGHLAPLLFNDKSMCASGGSADEPCKTETFAEADRVRVQGEMTENGVQVKHILFE